MSLKSKNAITECLLHNMSVSKGLVLLTHPTGSGKSRATFYALAEKMIEMQDLPEDKRRKLIFLTPRVKEVSSAYDGICKALKDLGHGDLVETIGKVDSFENSIERNCDLISNSVTHEWDETEKFCKTLNFYKELKTKANKNDSTVIKMLHDRLFGGFDSDESQFRYKLRKEFYKAYKKYKKECKECFSDAEDEIGFMKHGEKGKWSFIAELYPSVNTLFKNVLVMTDMKFFYKNDPIIVDKFFFNSERFIENAVVVIDEIDAIKGNLFRMILDKKVNNDVVDLFKLVYKNFQRIDSMYDYAIEKSGGKEVIGEIKERSEEIKNKYFPEKWLVRFFNYDENSHTLNPVKVNNKMMNYRGSEAYYDAKNQYRFVPYRKKNRAYKSDENDELHSCNKITPLEICEEKSVEGFCIDEFLEELTTFLNKTFKKIYNLANSYEHNREMEDSKAEGSTIIYADEKNITTFLESLNFERIDAQLVAQKIMNVNIYRRYVGKLSSKSVRKSIYNKGFYYTNVVSKDDFRDSSILQNYEVGYTPELILADLATKANVIGISATAEIKGRKNFNFDFIKEYLEDVDVDTAFYTISTEDRKKMNLEFEQNSNGNKERHIKIQKICNDDSNISGKEFMAMLYSGNKKVTEEDLRNLDNLWEMKKYKEQLAIINESVSVGEAYDFSRLKKVLGYLEEVFKNYKKNKKKDIKSMPCNGIILSQKLPSENPEDIYSLENLRMGAVYIYFRCMCKPIHEAIDVVKDMFIKVDASLLKDSIEAEKIKSRINKRIMQDLPVFMITSYGSTGRAFNPQFNIGKDNVKKMLRNERLIRVNNWDINGEVDWSSIYLDKPTYNLPSIKNFYEKKSKGDGELSKNIADQLMEILFVIEEMYARNSISLDHKRKILKEVFMAASVAKNINHDSYNILYGCAPVKKDCTAIIYQAIGRLCRTGIKNQETGIYYDENLLDAIEVDFEDGELPCVTKEFEEFIIKILEEKRKEEEKLLEEMDSEFVARNAFMKSFIDLLLDSGNNNEERWPKALRELWEDLRIFLLKHPVIGCNELEQAQKYFQKNKIAKAMGFKVEKLYLNFEKDLSAYNYGIVSRGINRNEGSAQIIIPTDKKNSNRKCKFEVSVSDSRVDMLMGNKVIRKHWNKNGFSTDWSIDKKDTYYGVISPVVYTNLYKGAVGEEAVKAVLQSIGIRCMEIEDGESYEMFDFIAEVNGEESKKIFIDAKNFSETSMHRSYANEELLEKVTKKVDKLEADLALIINIVDKSGERQINEAKNGKIYTVPGLFYGMGKNDCRLIRYADKGYPDVLEKILIKVRDCMDNN